MNSLRLLGSMALVVIISLITGVISYTLFEASISKSAGICLIALIVQVFVGDIIYRIKAAKDLLQVRTLEQQMVSAMENQFTQVTCPCDKRAQQMIVIDVNTENLYTCNKCDAKLKCLVGTKTFQITEPLTEDPFKNFDFTRLKDYDTNG